PGRLRAVYAFGMPRAGTEEFARAYNATLGPRTFRLVHGEDLVPTVPPSEIHAKHVGLLLSCPRLGKFNERDLAKAATSDEPDFVNGFAKELHEFIEKPLGQLTGFKDRFKLAASLLAGFRVGGLRTDLGGIAIELLPLRLRDHMPDRYISATQLS